MRQAGASTDVASVFSASWKHCCIYNLLIEKCSSDNLCCSWLVLSWNQKPISGPGHSGVRRDKKEIECWKQMHERFRRTHAHISTAISNGERSFYLLFVSTLTATNVVLFILCLIRSEPNERCVYPVCHLRKWLGVRYLYIRIILADSLLFDTNLILSPSLSLFLASSHFRICR